MSAAVDADLVAQDVQAVLEVLRRELVTSASVSGVYETDSRSDGHHFRVCVSVNGWHVWQPRYSRREDAVAYREAVGAALDRAT